MIKLALILISFCFSSFVIAEEKVCDFGFRVSKEKKNLVGRWVDNGEYDYFRFCSDLKLRTPEVNLMTSVSCKLRETSFSLKLMLNTELTEGGLEMALEYSLGEGVVEVMVDTYEGISILQESGSFSLSSNTGFPSSKKVKLFESIKERAFLSDMYVTCGDQGTFF